MKYPEIEFSEELVRNYTGNITQLGGLRHSVLQGGKSRGCEAVDFTLGSGLAFTVLPERGMDIAWASYRGVPLCYMAKPGVVSSAHYEPAGIDWLRSFFAGMLTTCGLSNVGNPAVERHVELGEVRHGLHGRISNTPAEQLCLREEWKDGKYVMSASGLMREAILHGDHMTLRRSITAALGEKSFTLSDRVSNEGAYEHHLSLLYHINIGYPLLGKNSRVVLNPISTVGPDDDFVICREPSTRAPQLGYAHDLAEGPDGLVYAAVINDELEFGLAISYKKAALPKFNEWKVMSTGEYVIGLEPGTCLPISREKVEEQGEALIIPPGGAYDVSITFTVLDGNDDIGMFMQAL